MPTSFQTVRSKRERDRGPAPLPPLPEKPEDVRFGIVFLYASCAVALVFLIIAGDVQWSEAVANNLTATKATIVEMVVTALALGGCGFLLSRGFLWPLYAVCGLTVLELCFLVAVGGQLFTFSQGFFVSRLLSLLMDGAALFHFFRKPAKAWFAMLRERTRGLTGKERSGKERAGKEGS